MVFKQLETFEEADVIFVNTCSIREKAEQTVRKRLRTFHKLKENKKDMTIGVLRLYGRALKIKILR